MYTSTKSFIERLTCIGTESDIPITCASLMEHDCPLVYVNPAFCRMTGYSQEQVIGKNCRFLQANFRNQPGVELLRELQDIRKIGIATVRNFRADGSLFINEILICPIFEKNRKEAQMMLGFQRELSNAYGNFQVKDSDSFIFESIWRFVQTDKKLIDYDPFVELFHRLSQEQSTETVGWYGLLIRYQPEHLFSAVYNGKSKIPWLKRFIAYVAEIIGQNIFSIYSYQDGLLIFSLMHRIDVTDVKSRLENHLNQRLTVIYQLLFSSECRVEVNCAELHAHKSVRTLLTSLQADRYSLMGRS